MDPRAHQSPSPIPRHAYRGGNVIERAFNGFKHWRGLATRYDKHASVYRPQRTMQGKESTYSFPLSMYIAPGGLRQAPGRAA